MDFFLDELSRRGPLLGAFALVWLATVGLWLWALVDALRGRFEGNNKLVWVVLMALVPPVGMLLYLLIGREQKLKE